MVVDFFAGLSPLATFEGFAQTIGGVFSKLFDVLKNTFASTYNWIVEKLNKIPGVNIDLKTVSPPAAAAVPANAVIPDSAAGSSKLNSPSVLTGNRINAGIPRGGLMSQVKNDSKTAVDNRKTWAIPTSTPPMESPRPSWLNGRSLTQDEYRTVIHRPFDH
ncbi:putative tail tape measure protein from bacteriophage origin [Escherichia coli]|uniref:Putative tail tape measure protein from bacteriophage origin n=1 Tax=Escherichia coli TaxID=562 RepID=A0A2X3KD31_ECOLX|nr:putative tail tape measure protein from bacteriophage origin [Escherichia coli]